MDCTAAGARAASGHGMPGAMLPRPSEPPPTSGALCVRCELRTRCLGAVAAEAGTAQLKGVLTGRPTLRPREVLYAPGDGFAQVYVVRRGALKSSVRRDDGEQVTAFHFAGELVGLDGMPGGRHRATVTALEESELCAMRFAPRPGEPAGVRAILARLWDVMSCEIVRERAHQGLLATLAPRQRVAAFLASVAARTRGRPWPLDAADIRSYLRLDTADPDAVIPAEAGIQSIQ